MDWEKPKMKREIKIYKYWHAAVKFKNFIPSFTHSRNVQGWFFIRNYTFEWFKYAVNYRIVIKDREELSHNDAHEPNVLKYMTP